MDNHYKHIQLHARLCVAEGIVNDWMVVMLDLDRYRGKGRPRYSDYTAYTIRDLVEIARDNHEEACVKALSSSLF